MEFDYSARNKRWRHKRERILKRDHGWCQESLRYGRHVPAEVVHHCWPVEDYPEYAYCDWNLVSLSKEAHERMHERNSRKLTALGIFWLRKASPPVSPRK